VPLRVAASVQVVAGVGEIAELLRPRVQEESLTGSRRSGESRRSRKDPGIPDGPTSWPPTLVRGSTVNDDGRPDHV
jgi:hypothetical protein